MASSTYEICLGFSPPTKHALHMFFRLLGTGPVHLPKHKCFSDFHHLPKHNKCFSVFRVPPTETQAFLGFSADLGLQKYEKHFLRLRSGENLYYYQSTIFLPVSDKRKD
ncbi:5946_t:CDS:2 [Ambispora leptoticha]|uniref:5946_t:CDS:1 n=1 Tax=Ambispora leptoticha TaxID=144679 RepID=A0A9N9H175_9GLOM|nr:5946_t:CDS:2 [Ambispora leptoticha]